MSREDPPLRIRLPEELKARVQAAAGDAHRSMNAEIVARLEQSFELRPAGGDIGGVGFRMTMLEREVEALAAELRRVSNAVFTTKKDNIPADN